MTGPYLPINRQGHGGHRNLSARFGVAGPDAGSMPGIITARSWRAHGVAVGDNAGRA